ncbi:hypothetical protein BK133_26185 [Paenibacillus sp. FSL H8-0548]|uniref:Gmad2 immunoglobulin-like domain-containing protein n=1 Tax=Paenibacillus sp. FSL H8-0548 TaxID=1920422 RepID=UPI00096E1965|nr:Gmad2 immunoglobulin-like domain-containing protein [Paenibacillus sp. FSL H8-0548]OMF22530.1 hypothetical protein BK133_26185 [Paenibacillus sp. FSL H8-0548]
MTIKKNGISLFILCIIVLLSACSSGSSGGNPPNTAGNDNPTPAQNESTPGMAIERGEIVQKEKDRWLITAYIDKGEESYVDAYWFSHNDQTELLNSKGEAVPVENFKIGAQVTAWHDGKLMESYPVQTNAAKIILLEEEERSDVARDRTEAIKIVLEAQTELAGAWAVKQAALDSQNEFWYVVLVHFNYVDQPVTVRLNAKTGEIVSVPAAENDTFRVYTPQPDEEVGSVFAVEGEARVFEGAFNWHLEDGHNILAEGQVMAEEGAPEWGRFLFEVSFESASQPNLSLFIYVKSAKDGSSEKQLVIPLKVPEEQIKYSADQ